MCASIITKKWLHWLFRDLDEDLLKLAKRGFFFFLVGSQVIYKLVICCSLRYGLFFFSYKDPHTFDFSSRNKNYTFDFHDFSFVEVNHEIGNLLRRIWFTGRIDTSTFVLVLDMFTLAFDTNFSRNSATSQVCTLNVLVTICEKRETYMLFTSQFT